MRKNCRRFTGAFLAIAGFSVAPAIAANTLPVASSGSSPIVLPGESADIELTATDADADTLSYIITALPTKGTLTADSTPLASTNLPYTIASNGCEVTYTASATGHAADTFKFKANDGTGDSALATVTVVINRPPVASTTSLSTKPSTDLKTKFPATDPDSDKLTFVVTTLPGHGRLKIGSTTLADGDVPYTTQTTDFTYSPDPEFHGEDRFRFTAADTWATSSPLTASIQVNTTPVPQNLTVSVLPNSAAVVQFDATDADRDPVTYTIMSLPVRGVLDVDGTPILESDLPKQLLEAVTTVNYIVDAGYRGTDSFHYRASDGVAQSDRAVVSIAVNTPPVATNDVLHVVQDQTATGTLSPTDVDGDTLTIRLASLPAHGTLTVGTKAITTTGTDLALSAGTLTYIYKPTADYVGSDGFTYQAADGKTLSATATVSISVSSSNSGAGDDTSGTDTTGSDEQVLSDTTEPGTIPVGCAPLGAAELFLSALGVTVVRRARQFSN